MNGIEPFDPATMPLHGIRLVEASAGTGKTFSLAGLYLRLIVEQRLDVREILVMTFTRPATQELRERLRERLARAAYIAAREPGERDDAADAFAERVIAGAGEARADVAARLRDAATRVDQATITTIHGFAHKAVAENAFESALPFDRGEQADDGEVRREATTDYWRTRVFGHDSATAHAFLQLWPAPESLYQEIREVLGKPHARLLRPDVAQVERDRDEALRAWPGVRAAFVELLDRGLDEDALLKKDNALKPYLEQYGAEALAGAIDAGLAGTAEGLPGLPAIVADLGDDEGVRRHAKKAATGWFRPQDLDGMPLIARLQVQGRLAGAARAIDAVRERSATLKRERRLYSFDDMIAGLHASVTDERHGPALAAALRRTWPVALVDEFQDTDSTQYAILKRIYGSTNGGPGLRSAPSGLPREGDSVARMEPQAQSGKHGSHVSPTTREGANESGDGRLEADPVARMEPQAQSGDESSGHHCGLILIGDPKQAIYGFRGGDVFAWLDAAKDADGRYGMDTNFRSTPAVLQGLDALFTKGGEHAFVLDGIDFRHVEAGRAAGDRRMRLDGEELPGVTAWSIAEDTGTEKKHVRPALEEATVSRIAALLDPDRADVLADGGRRPVRPGDIAVLVNSNAEAAAMQEALTAAGVPAVCIHQDSVFTTEAAHHLLLLLRAAAVPFDRDRLRVALTTPLFGHRLGDLVALDAEERHWTDLADHFQQAHLRWANAGVQAMAEPFLQDAAERIVGLHDGERRMTDCLHVVERLQQAEHEVFGMEGLVRWLEDAIHRAADNGEVGDDDRLRLENDSDLVQVTTVHKAKGLQFPVVFVPYAPWLGTGGEPPTRPPYSFHDAHNEAVIDLGSSDAGHHREQALRERRAEQVRALYVALTRAEQACFFSWGAIKNAADSPLAWLLHQEDGADFAQWLGGKKPPDWLQAATGRLAEIAGASGGVFVVEPLPAADAHEAGRATGKPEALEPARDDFPRPRRPWSVFSFSGLAGRMAALAPAAGADDVDAMDALGAERPAEPEIAVHPRGAGFGQAFHELMERIDFAAWPAPGDTLNEERRSLVAQALRRHGVATADERGRALPVDRTAAMVGAALHTALPEIGPLARVAASDRRAEIEFFLRLGGSRGRDLMTAIADAGYGAGAGVDETVLRGLMQGFIDLVVEADGRFRVIDYKTNALGPMRADYAPDRLAESVRHHHYDLQYLIYTVALHRYLRQRLPGYEPEKHLGGVQYLFVRAMKPGDDRTGIHRDRPPVELIKRLDALFDGMEIAA